MNLHSRFNLAQQPKEFTENRTVADLLHKSGKKALPVTLVNGEAFRTGTYPSYEELCNKLGIEQLKNKPLTVIS